MKRLAWMYKIHTLYHWIFLFCLYMTPVLLFLGYMARSTRTKFQKIFRNAGLVNGLNDTPKLIRIKKLDRHRKSYIFDSNGIGLSEFAEKKARIEAHFRSNIESIKHG